MGRPLLIIHGWSDNADSFKPLAELLTKNLQRNPLIIDLANYISMDDEITFDDLVTALSRAWKSSQLPSTPASVDVIVHSTGGLIIRDWLTRNFTPQTTPIKHLVMLAPANFGSPLAHKGQAFIGRVIEGFNSQKFMQVGAKILKGLELASPYTWQLAQRDRFSAEEFYGPGKILCTVLVGNTGLTGIAAAANEDGGDGVVRISTANMNCAFLEADFSVDPFHPTCTFKTSNGTIAFAVMDQENHRTIAAKNGGFQNPNTLNYILQGLSLTDENLENWCNQLTQVTTQVMQQGVNANSTHGFQNTVSFVYDQFNQHVQDYFLEFYYDDQNMNWVAQFFHGDIITTTHAFSDDNSYRSLYIDCTLLLQQLSKNLPGIQMSLTALPEFNQNKNVGYRTFTDSDIGSIPISKTQIPIYFVGNRTLFFAIKLRREQADQILMINSCG